MAMIMAVCGTAARAWETGAAGERGDGWPWPMELMESLIESGVLAPDDPGGDEKWSDCAETTGGGGRQDAESESVTGNGEQPRQSGVSVTSADLLADDNIGSTTTYMM